MDRKLRPMFAVTVVTLSLGCAPSLESGEGDEGTPVAGRWYSVEQIQTGSRVFQDECAQCHGAQAQGITADWRERLDDGSFPPPPLNGSAHAWHHPLSVLLQLINQEESLLEAKCRLSPTGFRKKRNWRLSLISRVSGMMTSMVTGSRWVVLSKFREAGVRRVVLMMVAFAHCLLSLQVSAQLGGSFPCSLSFTLITN